MRSTRADPGRELLVVLFRRSLAAVHGATLTQARLRGTSCRHVIALGKAAESLAAGAWKVASQSIQSGFLAQPWGYETGELPADAPFIRCLGGHPIPDQDSLAAGAALERYVRALPADATVAVLISGGASACVEIPCRGVDLELLQRANRWLVDSGLSITDVNRVRAGLSRLKAGGLAALLGSRGIRGLVLVDVPGGDARWVGGGPLAPLAPGPLPDVPRWLRRTFAAQPAGGTTCLERLAGNEEAVAAVVAAGAAEAGRLAGDAEDAARAIARFLRNARPGTYVWGGETIVRLPRAAGRGGRCRHIALAVAQELAGCSGWRLLAAGSDGWDGSDPVAGACVDGSTVARGTRNRSDAASALAGADSGRFLAASGDELVTGPTGTNVNDLVIASVEN